MKSKLKQIIFFISLILLLMLLSYLCSIIYTIFLNKINMENSFNRNNIFTINKIVLFSSASASSTINTNSTTTITNLIQYTDIAIFINNNSKEFNLENTLKSVSIENVTFNNLPKLGTANLYYKDLNTFSTPEILDENLINKNLNFEISTKNNIDFSKPILYNNCANPITISYKNSNLITDYTINNENIISYDGSLLKNCNIVLNNLKCSFSFYIVIENNLGHKYRCPIHIDIPLSNDTTSIYDSYYIYTYNPNYSFYLYT